MIHTVLLCPANAEIGTVHIWPIILENFGIVVAPIIKRVDNAIHCINIYPADNAIVLPNTYPLKSDLSAR